MVIEIDGFKIENTDKLHAYLKENLDFPHYYGGNFDALWDMFSAWIETPICFKILNQKELINNMTLDDYIAFITLLIEATNAIEKFDFKIE